MAHEVDGQGDIKIHSFTVVYLDDCGEVGEQTQCFTDYTRGWDWVRRCGADWEGIDARNRWEVDIDSDWVEDDDDIRDAYVKAHEKCVEG